MQEYLDRTRLKFMFEVLSLKDSQADLPPMLSRIIKSWSLDHNCKAKRLFIFELARSAVHSDTPYLSFPVPCQLCIWTHVPNVLPLYPWLFLSLSLDFSGFPRSPLHSPLIMWAAYIYWMTSSPMLPYYWDSVPLPIYSKPPCSCPRQSD